MVDSPFELLPIGIRFMASLVFNPPQFGQVLQEMRVVSVQFFLFCPCPCLYYTKFLLQELVLEAAGSRQAGKGLSRSVTVMGMLLIHFFAVWFGSFLFL